MKKLVLLLFFVVNYSFAQYLPYLNASTGNVGQSFTDADTNLYMYHGNRLEKVNKNLVPVWVNTYSIHSFNNVLLSKTGSMYFIASGTTIGKIDANGNLIWLKSLGNATVAINPGNYVLNNLSCNQLMLDRNNNLIVTGSGYCTNLHRQGFITKLDTNGTILKTRFFGNSSTVDFNNFHIVNDSLGNYKILTSTMIFEGFLTFILNYSETADSVTHLSALWFASDHYGPTVRYYKSRFGSEFYLGVSTEDNMNYTSMAFYKFNNFKNTWVYNWGHVWQYLNLFDVLQEDEKGNLFLLASDPSTALRKGFIGLDSNGVYNGVNAKYFSNYPLYPNPAPSSQLHVLYNGNYFFDAISSGFPSNPLTIGYASMSCVNPLPIGAPAPTITTGTYQRPITYKVTSITTSVDTSSVAAVNNYSLNANFCVIMGIENYKIESSSIKLFPNPTKGLVTISTDENIGNIEIYNTIGELVYSIKCVVNTQELDLSRLKSGVYFLRYGTATQKIVKE